MEGNFWGKLIRELRRKQRISERELSRRCDIQPRTLKRYEEGKTRDIYVIELILKQLDHEVEAFSIDSIYQRYNREEMLRLNDPNRMRRFYARFSDERVQIRA
jgi:transcriptional regulator with XRE-family HTH domain